MRSLRDDIKYRVVSYLREWHRQDFGPDPTIEVLHKTDERAEEITDRVMRDVREHLAEVAK